MGNWITTWFYVQSRDEGGSYAQVRGDSSTEQFRDVYRRCLAVFFQSARRANPDAHLVLYLNEPWDLAASAVAAKVYSILEDLHVDVRVLSYEHQPPSTFAKAWRNQFFVLDVLKDLAASVDDPEGWLVLDSDIVWSGNATTRMWERLRAEGISTFTVGYDRAKVVNGLSTASLGEMGSRYGIPQLTEVAYSGGEFIGGRGDGLRRLSKGAHEIWVLLMLKHRGDSAMQFEEAHLLSLAYSSLGVTPGGMNDFTRRLWTQPFKSRNVCPADRELTLWHVPAEKKYGIRRLYRKLTSSQPGRYTDASVADWARLCQRELGIPTNSATKICRDVATAVRARLLARTAR